MTAHAYLSASASERWLKCPPSAKLCAQLEDTASTYAQEGTDAHALCEHLLLKSLGRPSQDPTGSLLFYDAEMQEAAEGYQAFVTEQIEEAKNLCKDPLICVEQKLDFSRWVERGFGTGDCVIVADGLLHIIDFKYGLGVLVSAKDNPQLKCYALGAVDTFGDLYDFSSIRLSIYQPRRENISTFDLTKDELLKWADEVLVPTAKLAYEGKGEFCAGDHCRFCKVRATCRAMADYSMQLAKHEFIDPPLLDVLEIVAVLKKVDVLVSWAEDVKEYALQQALKGTQYPGYKLVEGRSNRKYTDEDKVVKAVIKAGYDPYEKKLLGITAMEKFLGKKKFNEVLSGLVMKPQGKPVLAPNSDTRPEFNTAKKDFDDFLKE